MATQRPPPRTLDAKIKKADAKAEHAARAHRLAEAESDRAYAVLARADKAAMRASKGVDRAYVRMCDANDALDDLRARKRDRKG